MATLGHLIDEGQDALLKLQQLTLGNSSAPATTDDATLLREYAASLERKLAAVLQEKERDVVVCKASAECTFAKNYAGRVLVAIFDHAMGAKVDALRTWWETGSIQTRSGPGHWRLDPRTLRDKLERNLAKENAKVAQVELLVDTMGFDVNSTDLVGRTSLHHAAINGYEDLVTCLLAKKCNPLVRDKAGMTALSIVQQIAGASERIIQALLAAEKAHTQDTVVPSSSRQKADALASMYFTSLLEPFIHPPQFRRFQACVAKVRKIIQACTKSLDQHYPHGVTLIPDPADASVPFDEILAENQLVELLDSALDAAAVETAPFQQRVAIEASGFDIFCPVDRVTYPPGSWANWLQRTLLARSSASSDRHTWYYAALFQAQVQPLPGDVDLQKGQPSIACSSLFAACLPLTCPVLIQGQQYWITEHTDRTATLDRPFEGTSGRGVLVYSTESAVHPPYIGVLQLQERAPGNKFDKADPKDEMVQQYQRLPPDHTYEVGVQIGPTVVRKAASDFVKAWKHECKQLFQQRKCISGSAACTYSCPQKLGKYMCRDSMEKIGANLAQTTFGRSTYSKTLAPRALLQGVQDKYKGARGDKWPGCTRTPAASY